MTPQLLVLIHPEPASAAQAAQEGTPRGTRQGPIKSCQADLMAPAGQLQWRPAGSYLAVCGQFLVAVVRDSALVR